MFDTLNPQQQAAVDHDGSHLLIVAGAGTGKTKTLAARVARLLADDVDPERILLLTFTRRAAAEMIGRVGATRTRPRRRPGVGRHVPRRRQPHPAHARCRRRPRHRVHRARPIRQHRPHGAGPHRGGVRRAAASLPPQGDHRRHLLADGEQPGPTRRRARRRLPVVRRPRRRPPHPLHRLHRPQAGQPGTRLRRPAAVLAGAHRRSAGGHPAIDVRPRAGRRVPGHQPGAGRHRPGHVRPRHDRERGGRRRPGHLRLPVGHGGEHVGVRPALPGGHPGHHRPELSVDDAHPGGGQRGARPVARPLRHAAVVHPCPGGHPPPAHTPTTRAPRPARWPTRCSTGASGASTCGPRRCCSGPATTPTPSSSSSPGATSPT